MRENVKREILQIGRDAESLTKYIMDHGDNASPAIILAQTKLLTTHVQDLMESGEVK